MIFLEKVTSEDGSLIAIIMHAEETKEGTNFLSEKSFPLQLAVSSYNRGTMLKPHIHLKKEVLIREIQEIVHVESGCAKVDLYDSQGKWFKCVELSCGSTIFFVAGGHGFSMLEDTKLIEVKQGPYLGKEFDKVMINES